VKISDGKQKALSALSVYSYDIRQFETTLREEATAVGEEEKALGVDPDVAGKVSDCVGIASVLPSLGGAVGFPIYSTKDSGTRGYFAYFALMLSLTELGTGLREGAIHVLEREINYQRKTLENDCPPPGSSGCDNLERMRRLILLLRLEVPQSNIMNILQSSAVDAARLRLNRQIVDDFDATLAIFDPHETLRASLLKPDLDGMPATCARDLRNQDPETSILFGFLTFAQMSAKSNVLDIASRNRNLVGIEPALIATLDRYAVDLAKFDVDCASKLGAKATNNDKIIFLDSIGGYWEAEGENFGVSNNDKTRLQAIQLRTKDRIKALCNAKITYATAKRLLPVRAPSTDDSPFDVLDDQLRQDAVAAYPVTLQSGWDRADAALNNFAAKDVDDACK
jgi:hypothetical protein